MYGFKPVCVPQLEASQKEWMYRTAIGDLDAVTRLLLTDGERLLAKNKDFTSGYTGLYRDMVQGLVRQCCHV